MAKLSARGRTELVRLSCTKQITEFFDWPQGLPNCRRVEPRSYDVAQDREQYVFMSDTHVLYKLDCTWHNGQKHSYEWEDKGKSKLTVEQFIERLLAKGYEVVRSVKSS